MSITEVARLAGVAHSTVSRLINDRGGVAPETSKRIRAAMDQLGYRPLPPHRRRGRNAAPAGIRTGNICLLLVGTSRKFLQRPGVHGTVTQIEAILRQRGLTMILAMTAGLHDLPPAITDRKCDGLLIIGESRNKLPLRYQSFPAVWVLSSHTEAHGWADHVLPDNTKIGILAADYLAEHGHRHLAFVNDKPKHPGFEERGRSFLEAASGGGLEASAYVSETDVEETSEDVWGFDRTDRLASLVDKLLSADPRPTGLFVPTDEQTVGLYSLLEQRGLRPGEDVSIVSCDNQDFWLHNLTPRPVSIDLNFEVIGTRAVEQLVMRISQPEQPSGTRILIPPRLVEHVEQLP